MIRQTVAVTQRILTEYMRQRRGLIFWAVFPALMMLLSGDRISDSDYYAGTRSDGTKEFAVIIRSKNADELKNVGIQIGSAFDDVITARVTIQELRKILSLQSVRAVQASSKNRPQ